MAVGSAFRIAGLTQPAFKQRQGFSRKIVATQTATGVFTAQMRNLLEFVVIDMAIEDVVIRWRYCAPRTEISTFGRLQLTVIKDDAVALIDGGGIAFDQNT